MRTSLFVAMMGSVLFSLPSFAVDCPNKDKDIASIEGLTGTGIRVARSNWGGDVKDSEYCKALLDLKAVLTNDGSPLIDFKTSKISIFFTHQAGSEAEQTSTDLSLYLNLDEDPLLWSRFFYGDNNVNYLKAKDDRQNSLNKKSSLYLQDKWSSSKKVGKAICLDKTGLSPQVGSVSDNENGIDSTVKLNAFPGEELWISCDEKKIFIDWYNSAREEVLISLVFNKEMDFVNSELIEIGPDKKMLKRKYYDQNWNQDFVVYIDREIKSWNDIYQSENKVKPIQTNVKIAIIDSGVDFNHPELAYKIPRSTDGKSLLAGWDFEDNDPRPYDYSTYLGHRGRSFDHGTHVACIASKGLDVQVVPIRNGRSDRSRKIFEALTYAKSKGARLANISLGTNDEADWTGLKTFLLANPEFIVVTAAGNSGHDLAVDPEWPAAYQLPNLIVVGSVDKNGDASTFSNFNPSYVTIGSRGEKIYSCIPEGDHGYKSGTSMASPLVANWVARKMVQNPNIKASEIRMLMEKEMIVVQKNSDFFQMGGYVE